MELTAFTGDVPSDGYDYYNVKVTPANGKVRSFIGFLNDITWDFTQSHCIYAGNQQGGIDGSFFGFSDSVIEGHYTQYTVNGLFGTAFVFSQFDDGRCSL